ncbi:hypothetical protein H0Z60_06005 [Ectothiorhodospiraceae bacterium WFHF3C12]|nr:hypothetical protein [Ectothiorhodospiraceae bacterium WFHF3C12]
MARRQFTGLRFGESDHEAAHVMLKRLLHHESHAVELVLILLSVGPVMMSMYISYVTGEAHWFQRSGSLMVLFSAAVEYRRSYQRKLAEEAADSGDTERRDALERAVKAQSRPFWRSIPYVCYLQIFLGTLIWGYGDLLF